MTDQDEALTDEFDVTARWTVESVARLGPEHAIPAACRGSGGPSALAWLGQWLELRPGVALLDVGGGLGGPAAWAAEEHAARPVVTDPMAGAVRGARRLFDLPAAVATGQQLPFAKGSFAAAWALGVLSTTPAKEELLAEMHRVLARDGRAGLVAYVARGDVSDAPEGNFFPAKPELEVLLHGAGFEVVDAVAVAELPDAPSEWQRREQAVEDDLAAHHGDDERWARARADEDRVAALLADERVKPYAIRLRPQEPVG